MYISVRACLFIAAHAAASCVARERLICGARALRLRTCIQNLVLQINTHPLMLFNFWSCKLPYLCCMELHLKVALIDRHYLKNNLALLPSLHIPIIHQCSSSMRSHW